MIKVRKVEEGEMACRICNNFNVFHSCWKKLADNDFGNNCILFDRNIKQKTVVDMAAVEE